MTRQPPALYLTQDEYCPKWAEELEEELLLVNAGKIVPGAVEKLRELTKAKKTTQEYTQWEEATSGRMLAKRVFMWSIIGGNRLPGTLEMDDPDGYFLRESVPERLRRLLYTAAAEGGDDLHSRKAFYEFELNTAERELADMEETHKRPHTQEQLQARVDELNRFEQEKSDSAQRNRETLEETLAAISRWKLCGESLSGGSKYASYAEVMSTLAREESILVPLLTVETFIEQEEGRYQERRKNLRDRIAYARHGLIQVKNLLEDIRTLEKLLPPDVDE